jgi:hypothetical protein
LIPAVCAVLESFAKETRVVDMEKLEILEAKIEDMLALHHAVCEERDRLTRELEATNSRLGETMDQLRQHEAERADVKNRVERILGRLNGLNLS